MRALDDIRVIWSRLCDRFAAPEHVSGAAGESADVNRPGKRQPDEIYPAAPMPAAGQDDRDAHRADGFPAVWPH
jgi:hypothetical protein